MENFVLPCLQTKMIMIMVVNDNVDDNNDSNANNNNSINNKVRYINPAVLQAII